MCINCKNPEYKNTVHTGWRYHNNMIFSSKSNPRLGKHKLKSKLKDVYESTVLEEDKPHDYCSYCSCTPDHYCNVSGCSCIACC